MIQYDKPIKEQPTQQLVEPFDNDSLHIIYGSRTGNSMAAATLAYEYASHLGLNCKLHNMQTIDKGHVCNMKNMLIAVSTHGEGDPPAVVESFYHFMHSAEAPDMTGCRFSILALGDSSYKDFCKTGHDFRSRLLQLGGSETSPLVECDIDYEQNAMNWVRQAVNAFDKILPSTKKSEKEFAFEINKVNAGQDKLFYADVLSIKTLTKAGFEKRTLHLVASTKNFGSNYQPGDSFGIYAPNSRLLVDRLLKTLNLDGTHSVQSGGSTKLLKEALISDFELTMITPVVVEKYAEATNITSLSDLVNDKKKLEDYCKNKDVLDLIGDYSSPIRPQQFIDTLRKLSPRLYSVANSPQVFPDEVHFTISLMEYTMNNRLHRGVCSTYFADRIEAGDSIPIFLEANENFRMPDDPDKPIIMIATGTGLAPFRGFLQQRAHDHAQGDNWLIFGDRYSKSDFLYRNEMEAYFSKGILTKFNTAFSRDQADKVYVQHRMFENSKSLFNWIHERGALVYICGNKRTMGRSVKEALEHIIEKEGRLSKAQAMAYLEKMKTEKRLQADLY